MPNELPEIYTPKVPVVWKQHLPVALAVLLIGIGLGSAYTVYREAPAPVAAIATALPQHTPYDTMKLVADAAVVMDARTGEILFGKNEGKQLPLASLTKLMTALAATTREGGNATVVIASKALMEEGSSSLRAGERWKLADLIDQTLVASSNAGAAAIALAVGENIDHSATTTARGAFVSFMNTYAKELGMSQTYFLNPTGLDEGAALSGAYGSAADMGKLVSFITLREPRLLRATQDIHVTSKTEDKEVHRATNTNTAVRMLPFLRGSKTGLTDLAGGNLAVAFDTGPDHPVVAVVLGSTEQGRFTDIEKLVQATLERKALSENTKP